MTGIALGWTGPTILFGSAEQLLEVDGLALGFKLGSALLGGLHLRDRLRWHSPAPQAQLTNAAGLVRDDGRFVVGEYPRHQRKISCRVLECLGERDDSLLALVPLKLTEKQR